MTLGPATREGEQVFGVAHIYASFNDTFIVSIIIHFCKEAICFFSNYNVWSLVLNEFLLLEKHSM